MTEAERWGIKGLVANLRNNSPLVTGHDPSTLGLDLDSPDPLFPTFAGPFAEPGSRPIIPDFTLPSAYSVNNVPPLHTRIDAFSDETLFAIFYQYPRDVMQEIAAGQLHQRDWRWNIKERKWMMKDPSAGPPMRINDTTERGVYVFFDAMNWRRERVSLPLTVCAEDVGGC